MLSSRWLALPWVVLGGACAWAQNDAGAVDSLKSLNARIRSGPQGPAVEALIRNRFGLLRELIRSHPDRALAAALPDDSLALLGSAHPAVAAQLEQRGQWEGSAYWLVEDRADLRGGRTSLHMRLPDGELKIYPGASAPVFPGTRRYRVNGVRAGDRVAAASVVALDATSNTGSCSANGVQNTIAIPVNVPNSPAATFTAGQVQDWMFGSSLSLDGYWQDASYGKTSAAGEVTGWIGLDQAYTGDQYGELSEAVMQQAAAQGIDLTHYSRIFLFLPQLQGQGMEAGVSTIGCIDWSQAGATFSASVEWVLPQPGATDATILSVVTHEGGHGLGLDHSIALECGIVSPGPVGDACPTEEYGDPYSVMGEGFLGHYTAAQKYALGWLGSADVVTVPASGTVHIEPLSAQVSGAKALQTPRTAGGTDWLWVEVREPVGPYETSALDLRSLKGGAVIHFQPQDQAGPIADLIRTQIVDVWPGSLANGFGATVGPGSSWTDVFTGLTVSVGQAADGGLNVSVGRGNACAATAAEAASVEGAGGTGTIAVTAPAGCSWTATSAEAWLAVQGGASGAGNGTVTFQAAANPGATRQGLMTIGGLGVLVTQGAGNAVPVIAGASPQNSTGPSVVLTVSLSDSAPGNLATVSFNVTSGAAGTPVCMVTWNVPSQTIRLMNDDGVTFSSAGNGSIMDLENSHCAILSGAGSFTGAGNQMQLTVQAVWKGAAAGVDVIYMRATDTVGNDTGWQSVGTWVPTVDRAPTQPLLADAPGTGLQHAFVIQAADPDGASDLDTIKLNIGSGSKLCSMSYIPSEDGIEFLNDDGSWSGWAVGVAMTAQNQYCSVDLQRTIATTNGNALTLILPVTFTSALAGNQPVQAIVTDWSGESGQLTSSWTVAAAGAAPTISAAGIVNGASWTGGAVSAGELVTIFGSGLGPSVLRTAGYVGNELQQTVAGTTVIFTSGPNRGVAAPLIYVSGQQVSAIVPGAPGDSVSVEVATSGGFSNLVTVPTAAETPGIFTYANSSQAVAVNQDGSFNKDAPTALGSYITFFVTGAGLCNYDSIPFVDFGAIPPASPWALPEVPVFVQFGDDPAYQAAFAGLTWPGVLQVNTLVYSTAPTGDAVPLRVVMHVPSPGVTSAAATVRIE